MGTNFTFPRPGVSKRLLQDQAVIFFFFIFGFVDHLVSVATTQLILSCKSGHRYHVNQ